MKIYCTFENTTPRTADRIRTLFKEYDIRKRRLGKLTVCLFDRVNRGFPIDRWVRFGESVTLKFHGLRILQGNVTAGESCDLLETGAVVELREDELALEKNKNLIPIEIE